MPSKTVLLLLCMMGELQVAYTDCREKLCASSKGIQFKKCAATNGTGSRDDLIGKRKYEVFPCIRGSLGDIKEVTFEKSKCQWFDALDDAEYIAITEIKIPKGVKVTIGPLNDFNNNCKMLELTPEANDRQKIVIRLRSPERKFKITSSEKTAVIKFICNKARKCTKIRKDDGRRFKRIVRGDIVTDVNDFPFMANLYVIHSTYKSEDNYEKCNQDGFISFDDTKKNCCKKKPIFTSHCGGSILHRKWVLTAAHCVRKTKKQEINNVNTTVFLVGILVRAGDDKRNIVDQFQTNHWATPQDVERHTDYKPETRDSDIALLTFSPHIPLDDKKDRYPICLAPSNMDNLAGCEVEAAGWGRKDDDTVSNVLRKGEFKIHANCGNKITNNMLCFKDASTSVCNGDSGGPLFCDSVDDFYYEVGVTSFAQRPKKGDEKDIWRKGGIQGAGKVVNFLKWLNERIPKLP